MKWVMNSSPFEFCFQAGSRSWSLVVPVEATEAVIEKMGEYLESEFELESDLIEFWLDEQLELD